MSQDFAEICFSPSNANMSHAKACKQLQKALSLEEGDGPDFYSGESEDGKRKLVIQIASNQAGDLLDEALAVVANFPCDNPPYASLYLDQAGETLYYILVNGRLREFSSAEEIEEYLAKSGTESPEEVFFEDMDANSTLLLMRLVIPGKRVRQ